MATETIPLGLDPHIAVYIESVVGSAVHAAKRAVEEDVSGAFSLLTLLGDDPEDMKTIVNWMVTYLIAQHLSTQYDGEDDFGRRLNVNDYALRVVRVTEDEKPPTD